MGVKKYISSTDEKIKQELIGGYTSGMISGFLITITVLFIFYILF